MSIKTFRIVVDGQTYMVEVEEVKSDGQAPAGNPVPRTATAPAPVAAAPAPAPASPPASGQAVKAPLQGTVLDIPVKPGDQVKAGDILVVIEAMKMENEIVAPLDAVVDQVHANKGDVVASGDLLISFR